MKHLKTALFISISLLLVSGCMQEQVPDIPGEEHYTPEIKEHWLFNREILGDSTVTVVIQQDVRMEGQVNANEWTAAELSGGNAVLRFPVQYFFDGENIINVRSVDGSSTGAITSRAFYKGQYTFDDTGSTGFNVHVRQSGNPVTDAIVEIRNAKGTDDWNDDEFAYMLPDSSGTVSASGMVEYAQFWLDSDQYLLYDFWQTGDFEHTVNLRQKISGTTIQGTFLIRTQEAEVPITESHGDIAGIGAQYPDGGILISVCYIRYWGGDVIEGTYNTTTGQYRIENAGPGNYVPYCNILTPSGSTYVRSAECTVAAGQSIQVDYTAETRIGTITGTVRDALDNPLSGCYVRAHMTTLWNGHENDIYSDVVLTDEEGVYSIEILYGNYTVLASTVNDSLWNVADAQISETTIVSQPEAVVDLVIP